MVRNIDYSNLIPRLREGDEEAFCLIYRNHAAELIRFAENKLFDLNEARDLIQDLFTELWDKRRELPEIGDMRGFLFRAIKNKIAGRIKKQIVREKYLWFERKEEPIEHSIEELIYEKELWDKINLALKSAPKRGKEIFFMSKMDAKTNKEIAQLLNLSEQTVKNNLSMVLKLLRGHLNG